MVFVCIVKEWYGSDKDCHMLSFKGMVFTVGILFLGIATASNHIALTKAEVRTFATIAAIDKNEIILGDIALHKKTSSPVAALAQMMIDQHGANLTQILEMTDRAAIKKLTSKTAKKIALDGNQAMLMLGGLDEQVFSKAYVNAMVQGHEAALKLINTELMQTATTPEVKEFMTATKAAVEMHLAAAKKLQ